MASGLLGVGGGIVMVPLLVWLCSFEQKNAHATSLGAIIPIAAAGAAVYAIGVSVDLAAASVLAVGGIAGAPVGAKLLSLSSDPWLKIGFGVLNLIVGISMVTQ